MSKKDTAAAERIRQVLIDLSPMIEEYTARVCPDCRDICCKQRHGIMNDQDLRFLSALNVKLPSYEQDRPPDGPCQFMAPEGCTSPRWLRPWRCTSFFCDALLDVMNSGPQKKARQISALIQEIVDIRSSW
jgi:hypothetical protein